MKKTNGSSESNKTSVSAAQLLRQRAEQAAREKAVCQQGNGDNLTAEEARQTLHELQVHQIELEMQNDELRRTQMELDEARIRYFDLFDLAPVGYCVVSDQGLILEPNLTAANLLGADRSTLLKQPIARFVCPEDQDILYFNMKQLFASGNPQECELQMMKQDGASFDAHLILTVAPNDKGTAVGRVVLSDITRRKKAEDLLENRNLSQKLVATISTDLVNAGMDNIDQKINNILKIIGQFFAVQRCYLYQTVSDDRVVLTHEWSQPDSQPNRELFPEISWLDFPWWAEKIKGVAPVYIPDIHQLPDAAASEIKLLKGLKTQSLLNIQLVHNHQLKGFIGFDAIGIKKLWPEDQIDFLEVIANILSDALAKNRLEIELQRGKEKAEKDMILKTEYFGTFSHELRTPLNVILAAIQLFEMYNHKYAAISAEKTTKHLKAMKQNALRLLRLVNNLIDITKIDSGFYEPAFHNYDIVSIIKEISLSVADYAGQKNISVLFESDVTEKIVKCDVDMMERIVLNLVSNAIKFSRENNQIRITITHKPEVVIIAVQDNGIGIEKRKHELVFERYKKAEEKIYQKGEGSGIGLSLTKELVEMHGGKISLKSEYGQGSEFTVEIPNVIVMGEAVQVRSDEDISIGQLLLAKMNVEFSDIYL